MWPTHHDLHAWLILPGNIIVTPNFFVTLHPNKYSASSVTALCFTQLVASHPASRHMLKYKSLNMIFIVTWKRQESTCRTTMVEVTQHPVMLASVGGSGGTSPSYLQHLPQVCSGRFRNLERGVQPRVARKAHPKIFGLPRQLPVMFMKSELNISKQLQA